jgi:ATP/ADP translocase
LVFSWGGGVFFVKFSLWGPLILVFLFFLHNN